MKPYMCLMGVALLGLLLPACQGASNDTAVGDAGMAEAIAAGGAVATDDASTERLFAEGALDGEGCPLLGVADVTAVVGVAASDIETSPVMDCYYAWDAGSVFILSTRVYRSIERAREQYAGATQDLTAAEMQAGIRELGEQLDAKAAAGEISEDQAAIGGAMVGAMAGSDVTNTDVAGVGDQASHDGTRLLVRVGNVIFHLEADSGDNFDPGLSKALAQRAVHNLEQR